MSHRNRTRFVLCCLALVCAATAGSADVRNLPVFRFGIASDEIGRANLLLTDITGDARPEIVSCSAEAPVVLAYSAGTYVPVWRGPSVHCAAVAAGDADGDGATEIIVAATTLTSTYGSINGGKVLVFDPRGFGSARLAATLPGNEPATDIAFGNVDFDASPEIVAVTEDATHVFDARTLQLQWSADGYGGNELFLADIDGDSRLEIIVNEDAGLTAYVLDGGTEEMKWGYAGGFGQGLFVGNVDADAKAEIVFADGWDQDGYTDIVILNGDFSSSTIPFDGLPVGIGDANGDGVNEVITDMGYLGLKGLRPSDGAVLWTNDTPQGGVFGNVAVGDVDGDAKTELVFGAGNDSFRDILIVIDVVSHAIEHEGIDLDGPFYSATGDVDGDGRPDLVIASAGSNSGYHGGIVQIVDPVSGAVKGVLSQTGLTYYEISAVAIGQLDGDAAKEIITIGRDFYDPMLVVWDSVTREIEWKSPEPAWGDPEFATRTMAVVNLDGDAVDEIVIGRSDKQLLVLNGASPVIQASKVLDGWLVALAVADVDGDGTLEVVAGTDTTLYLLDTAGWSVIEETPLSNIRSVAAAADDGGRIAVTVEDSSRSKVRLYDLTLTASWTCELHSGYDPFGRAPVTFADFGGETRLVAGAVSGTLHVFPLADGPACPASSTIAHSARAIFGLHSTDVSGDGRRDLVVNAWDAVAIELVGLTAEARGDTDGDGDIAADDIDELVDTLFGAKPGALPTADVNADERISPEDVFNLIHYKYSGGPEPQP